MEVFKHYAAAVLSGLSILGVTVLFANLSAMNDRVNSLQHWRTETMPYKFEIEYLKISKSVDANKDRISTNTAQLSMLEAEIALLQQQVMELR